MTNSIIKNKTIKFDKLSEKYKKKNYISKESKYAYVAKRLSEENRQLKTQLDKIKGSKAWKIMSIYYKAKDLVLSKKSIKKLYLRTKNKVSYLSNQSPLITKSIELEKLHKLSEILTKNSVNVITPTFFDYDGENYYCGGAERYLTDIALILNESNTNMNIFQYGNYPWVRKFNNITVISLAKYPQITNGNMHDQEIFSKNFYDTTNNNSLLNIYSPFFINHIHTSKPSIGISHGIAWDNPKELSIRESALGLVPIVEKASSHDTVVSVDTNTPKFIQSFDYDSALKMKYIPNYVDTTQFHPRSNYLKNREKIIVLFPRRFYKPRGLYLTINAAVNIINNFPETEFHFVGRGFPEDTKHLDKLKTNYPNNVKIYSKTAEEMPEVYKESDITIIPTLYSEGTSLSLLEAMASGNAVIATRIGGLTDLVINNLNGYLIEPNEEELYNSIEKLVTNKKVLQEMKLNARNSSFVFNKERWKEEWRSILSKYIQSNKNKKQNSTVVTTFNKNPLLTNNTRELKAVTKELKKGNLVNIKSNDESYNKRNSYGRLQFVR